MRGIFFRLAIIERESNRQESVANCFSLGGYQLTDEEVRAAHAHTRCIHCEIAGNFLSASIAS